MSARRIAAVTTSRADFGLIAPVLSELQQDSDFDLKVIAARPSGDDEFADIETLGFVADAAFRLESQDEGASAAASALADATRVFAEAFGHLSPDLVLLPGDRFEMLGAASAALLARIPVAHVFGGDVTEGALDDAVRHALTKLSHLHFCTNEPARLRILQMGEDPACVSNTGSPALDAVAAFTPSSRDAFFSELGIRPRRKNCLVTHHPTTLGDIDPIEEVRAVLAALEALGSDVFYLFTGVNIDPGYAGVAREIKGFVDAHPNAHYVETLGQARYFNALTHMDVVVGNSSSGLYEAPSFKIPTVNIGPRQDGRLRAASVIDCPVDETAVVAAIKAAFELDCSAAQNPYGDGRAVPRILQALKAVPDWSALTQKRFFVQA